MAVIVQYIVEREGVQKMTFADRREADAYDRMLDVADELHALLREGELGIEEDRLEEVALYLAKNRDQAAALLKGAKPKPKGAPKADAPAAEAAETEERAQTPRRAQRKAA